MSEMQPPPDEPSFGHYWAWVAREKLENELYRLIRTTPGLVDRSHVVEDIEAASKELVSRRREHLQELVEGWEIIERTMTKEIATRIFNEFIAGCRTLEDFERLNFSKKFNEQGKLRNQFAQHLNGQPILSCASVPALDRTGVLPSTSIIYTPTMEFYSEATTDKYYDMLFGDCQIFHDIMKKYNPNPNMPAPKAIPMPYHPNMDKQNRDFVKWHQVVQPYTNIQNQLFTQPPPPIQYAVSYPQIPYVGMPIQMQAVPLPMQIPPENFAGANYQKNQQNGFYGNGRGGHQRQPYKGRNEMYERNGYDSFENQSSSSVRTQSVEDKKESAEMKAIVNEAFPALSSDELSDTAEVDVAIENQPAASSQAAVLPTPRKFSDVVSQSVSTTSSNADASEVSAPVDGKRQSDSQSIPSAEETRSSDSPSATSISSANTLDPTTSSSESSAVKPSIVPTSTALVVDTTEHNVPVAPPASHRTVAEVVQQSLSATPSPSAKRSGVNSNQASPAVKPTYVKGTAQTISRERSSAEKSDVDDYHHRRHRSPKKPSVSYAQMLYPLSKKSPKPSNDKKVSFGAQSPSAQSQGPSSEAHPTEWHTVKNKKAAEPVVVSPPLQTPREARKAPQKPFEADGSSDEDEEGIASDDSEAEKKREKRRLKRQKQKEANRVIKQHEKERARKESLARSDRINQGLKSSAKPALFDPFDIQSRRKKRIQLQNQKYIRDPSPTPKPPPIVTPPTIPIIPLVPTGMGSNPIGASISAGQAAMAAYGVTAPFRNGSSPFTLIAANAEGLILDGVGNNTLTPVRLVRNIDVAEHVQMKTEMDENAAMLEQLLLFDALQTISPISFPAEDEQFIAKGMEDMKKMYSRVERAGQLITYRAGSSRVNSKTEEKLMSMILKLLSSRVTLEEAEMKSISEIGDRVAECSRDFNYTNYLTAIVDFSRDRAMELPEGMAIRKNYEQCISLTKLYMKRTKVLHERISLHFNLTSLTE
uniref:Bromo domain-containing protein n=1 Tax=Caenorhabditis tropicalis TaxID=1561998 RepID=A0A1I7USD1_9PELO